MFSDVRRLSSLFATFIQVIHPVEPGVKLAGTVPHTGHQNTFYGMQLGKTNDLDALPYAIDLEAIQHYGMVPVYGHYFEVDSQHTPDMNRVWQVVMTGLYCFYSQDADAFMRLCWFPI